MSEYTVYTHHYKFFTLNLRLALWIISLGSTLTGTTSTKIYTCDEAAGDVPLTKARYLESTSKVVVISKLLLVPQPRSPMYARVGTHTHNRTFRQSITCLLDVLTSRPTLNARAPALSLSLGGSFYCGRGKVLIFSPLCHHHTMTHTDQQSLSTLLRSITCIPAREFYAYENDVTLTDMPSLVSIGESAFGYFRGILQIQSDCPSLQDIGDLAFHQLGLEMKEENDPEATRLGLTQPRFFALDSGNPQVFLSAARCLLEDCELRANDQSVIELTGMASLKVIGGAAFAYNSARLVLNGTCPLLKMIKPSAFWHVSNADRFVYGR